MDIVLSKILFRCCVHCLIEPNEGYKWKEVFPTFTNKSILQTGRGQFQNEAKFSNGNICILQYYLLELTNLNKIYIGIKLNNFNEINFT